MRNTTNERMLHETSLPKIIPEKQYQFAQRLNEAQEWLYSHGIEFRVLGSVATSAYIDKDGPCSLNFERQGAYGRYQRMPDVDIVVPTSEYLRTKVFRDELERRATNPIGIEILPSVCHFDFRPGEEHSFIVHKDLKVPFLTDLFRERRVAFLDISLTTVDPRTLFHTYVTLGGMLRKKDWPKALKLARLIRDTHISQFTENDMKPFHDFLASRESLFPEYQRYRIAANWLRSMVPNRINSFATYYGRYLQPIVFGASGRPQK